MRPPGRRQRVAGEDVVARPDPLRRQAEAGPHVEHGRRARRASRVLGVEPGVRPRADREHGAAARVGAAVPHLAEGRRRLAVGVQFDRVSGAPSTRTSALPVAVSGFGSNRTVGRRAGAGAGGCRAGGGGGAGAAVGTGIDCLAPGPGEAPVVPALLQGQQQHAVGVAAAHLTVGRYGGRRVEVLPAGPDDELPDPGGARPCVHVLRGESLVVVLMPGQQDVGAGVLERLPQRPHLAARALAAGEARGGGNRPACSRPSTQRGPPAASAPAPNRHCS